MDAPPVPADPTTFETLPFDFRESFADPPNHEAEVVEIESGSEQEHPSGQQDTDLDARIAYLQQLGIKKGGPGFGKFFQKTGKSQPNVSFPSVVLGGNSWRLARSYLQRLLPLRSEAIGFWNWTGGRWDV